MAAKKKKAAKKAAPKKKVAAKKKVAKKAKAAPKKATKKIAPKKAAKKAAPKAAKKPAAKKAAKPTTPAGLFVWRELTTPDVAQALAFYGPLFNWTSEEMDMGGGMKYTIVKSGDVQVGGITPPMPGAPSQSRWGQYVTVPSVDAAAETAAKNGATVVVPPMDIPTVGRFAGVIDPQGALLYPFTPIPKEGAGPQGRPPMGAFCWDECLTPDPDAAIAFYKKIYGWTVTSQDMGGHGTYNVLHAGEQMVGGIMKTPMEGVPPHWLSHVFVADLEASLAKAESLGGKQIVPPTPVPGMGRFAVILDPAGADIAMFQPDGM